jgi:Amidohydrolase family
MSFIRWRIQQLLACLIAAWLLTPLPSTAADYVVWIEGERAGHLKVQRDGSKYTTDFSFRNNGRGPDLKESFEVGARGLPVKYSIAGKSQMGAEVREQFELTGGKAVWESRIDRGEETVTADFAFAPLDSTVAYTGVLTAAMLAKPGEGFPTMGGAQVRAEVVARLTVEHASGPLPLALVVLTGFDLQPWYLWVRDDDKREFFAMTWPGWSILEPGFEAVAPKLLERQMQAVDERLVNLRQKLAKPLSGLTVIRDVRWFDAPSATMRGPSDVWLFDGRIAVVTAPNALKATPDQTVDGQGRSLIPGLWDMHAHFFSPGVALGHLAAGVTGVRDPAGNNEELTRLKRRLDAGELPGPTLVPVGFIEGRSPFSARFGIVADDLTQALAAVDFYAARGYRQLKLYNSIKPEWVKPIAAHAHRLGLRVGGHVPAFMRAEEAVRAGYDELTHINQVMLNFVTRPGDDSRTLVRFERVGSDSLKVDLKSPQARRFIELLRSRGTVLDLTLYTFESMFTQQQGQPNPSVVEVADHLPVLLRRGIRVADMDLTGEKLETFRRSYQRMLEFTLMMHRAGLTLVAGTDGWEGVGLHRELALYVKAGIPAPQALRIGTWNGARVAGQGERRGKIERGYEADLVLIDGDPSVNITDLRKATLVIQGRVGYFPSELHTAMGMKPFAQPARIDKPIAR